ncbi:MAG: transcription antitermination factor NusB [Clostridiales bacterium]|nr:transcription antitermination factor NusB [Candidatus Apopatousia equi]
MSRIKARESCFKLIFEYEFLKQKNQISLEDFLSQKEIEEEDKEYLTKMYDGVIANDEELNKVISSHLKGYTLERIFKIDLAILKLAIYEIEYMKEKPAVVINEAVELSKRYSTDNSYKFINGVLANIVKGE